MVADGRTVFDLAVVIDGNRPTADIDVLTDIAVPDIAEMGQFRAVTDRRVFDFHIISDFYVIADDRIGSEVDEGSDFTAIFDLAVVGVHELDMVIVAHLYIGHADIGSDVAVFADDRMALEDRPRIKYRIAADGNGRIDIGIIGIDDRNAVSHELLKLATAQNLFGFGHLLAGIDAQRFVIRRCRKGADNVARRYEHADDIGQIILALGIVIGNVMQHIPQKGHIKAVNAGVYFVDKEFFRRAVFLFDNFDDLPLSSRMTRPYPVGSGICAVSTVAAAPLFHGSRRGP